jgi:hypothetical protein
LYDWWSNSRERTHRVIGRRVLVIRISLRTGAIDDENLTSQLGVGLGNRCGDGDAGG